MRSTRILVALLATASLLPSHAASASPPVTVAAASFNDVVPVPVSLQPAAGVTYTLASTASIYVDPGASDAGAYLAGILRPSTGYALPVVAATTPPTTGVWLSLSGSDPSVGQEGYQLDVTASSVVIRARSAAGLVHGIQTLRQLLPAAIEHRTQQAGPWTVPGGRILDYPRFAYRGAMLDVSRHFFPVATVKRYLDQLALYKVNYLHLHLSDDQGWRIVIDSWPRLATYGGSTQVGGGPGGYYTKAQYQEIVAYAARHHITIVPEIDMPGHTNAALASYAELNCDGVAPPLYTGTAVGFSSLCVPKELTYTFVDNVVAEIAAMTPGPYFHLGGDEAHATSPSDYLTFVNRVQQIVTSRGKTVSGWHQIGAAQHSTNRIVQYWGTSTSDTVVRDAVARGARVIMSPANKAYIDMKYNASSPIGNDWAGHIEVQTAYEWNPGAHLTGVAASAVLGVEAPLWTETVTTNAHIDYLTFPRLPAIAELGWSPWATHDWTAFRTRLGAQGPRWTVMGIDFYRSAQVPWQSGDGGVTASSSLGTYQSYVPANMVDGNTSTFYWSNAAVTAGSWIQVDLGQTRTISRIDLLMGKPDSPQDYIHQGVLEVSANGTSWTALGSFTQAEVRTSVSATGRYVRYRATASQVEWLVTREFTVTATATTPVTASSSLATYQSYVPANMVDGNTSTFYWSSVAVTAGSWIRVDLGQTRTISRVDLLMGKPDSPQDYIHQGVLEVSADGVAWSALGSFTQAEIRTSVSATGRYVRYRATASQTEWLVTREFTIT